MARFHSSILHGKFKPLLKTHGWGVKTHNNPWEDEWLLTDHHWHGHGHHGSHGRWHGHHHKPAPEPPVPPQPADEYNWAAIIGKEARNSDGSFNNQGDTSLGSAGEQLLRVSPASYADDTEQVVLGTNPRDISNAILDQDASVPSSFHASDLFTYFGQFIDHDVDLTTEGGPETIGFSHANGDFQITRSGYVAGTGTDAGNPREYPNLITSYVDGSNIYGSHADVTSVLRDDGGASPYLLTSDGDYAPTLEQITSDYPGINPNNVGGGTLTVGGTNSALFVAGDVRANENIALTSMHTVWIREHNYQVDKFMELMPDATDNEFFDAARLVVEAEYQNIVFNEYLPLLLGAENIPGYAAMTMEQTRMWRSNFQLPPIVWATVKSPQPWRGAMKTEAKATKAMFACSMPSSAPISC